MTLTEGLQEAARRGWTRARAGDTELPLEAVPRVLDLSDEPVEWLERHHGATMRLPGGLTIRLLPALAA